MTIVLRALCPLALVLALGCGSEEPSFHGSPRSESAPAAIDPALVLAPRPTPVLPPAILPAPPASPRTENDAVEGSRAPTPQGIACRTRAAAVFEAGRSPEAWIEAEPHIECACDDGAAESCTALGVYHGPNGARPDLPRALAALRRACALGDSFGCSDLGVALSRGRGTDPDPAAALIAWRRACELGDGMGCSNAAASIGLGRAGPPDIEQARALFTRACALGDAPACAHMQTVGH